MAKGDKYIIERDLRDKGGELERIASYDSWKEASDAWKGTSPDPDKDVTMWFARVSKFKNGSDNVDTLACK
jgi:hypothetical protein